MLKVNGQTGLVQHLSRKLIPLVTGIGLLIGVLAPVTFWIHAHGNLRQMVTLYAGDLADKLRLVALESPDLWKYQTYKFIAITEGFHPTIVVSGFRILDEKGVLISGLDYQRVSWEPPGKDLSFKKDLRYSMGTAPIMFNDRQVGTVQVLADDAPVVRTSAILFCFSSVVGLGLSLLVYQFPLRVVRTMEEKINRLIADLREGEVNYLRLNEDLEIKVKERTRDLIEAQEELVRKGKLAILGQLSGSVGHELRNPLGVMSNAIYFLKMVHAAGDETTREYLNIIKQEIDNSLRIITDLLDFARTRPPQTKTVTARELADESLKKCVIPENIDLQTEIPDDLPLLRVDPLQISQVFTNFFTNAIQAMPNGGVLRVNAQWVCAIHESPLQTPTDNSEGFIEFSITDSGEGISPENMNKLFQPLFTTKPKGIGLGLVLCRNLVEANGGRIEVESETGKGTTFRVSLPIMRTKI